MTLVLALGLAGGLGAIARFVLDGAVSRRAGGKLPVGTFAVNVTGALVLGALIGAWLEGDAFAVVATGALGSYTTFSTWMLESQRLAEDGAFRVAALNVGVSLVAGLAAAWIGRELGSAL